MKKKSEINEFSLLISEKLRKKIKISVLSTHLGLLLVLILWYIFSNMQAKKEVIMKVKLFQLPPAPTAPANIKSTAKPASKKKTTKQLHTKKKKSVKKKKVKKKTPLPPKKKVKKRPVKKTPKKKAVKKVKKTPKKYVKKSKAKTKKSTKKKYLSAKDIKISKKVLSTKSPEPVRKIKIPTVSKQELSQSLSQSFTKINKNYKISTKRTANSGNISRSYFNQVSSVIYKVWHQPSKSETGRSNPTVELQVTVDSFGKITQASIIRKSSNRAMNVSVNNLLKNLKTLPTPPNGTATFSIILEVQN
jgi:TonB family protein